MPQRLKLSGGSVATHTLNRRLLQEMPNIFVPKVWSMPSCMDCPVDDVVEQGNPELDTWRSIHPGWIREEEHACPTIRRCELQPETLAGKSMGNWAAQVVLD